MSKLYVPRAKNTTVKSVCISMIYVIANTELKLRIY